MRDDFVNRRFIYKQSTPVSLQEISVLPNFDTFFHVFQPGQFGNKWHIVTNNGALQYYESRSLVVGLLNPWNDGTNQPTSSGSFGGPITGIRTPTRTCIGFDLSSLPDNAIIDEATLELTIDGSRSWSGGSVDNHPLTIRLMPSDISSDQQSGLDWNTSHTQGINCDIKRIPNILDKIKEVTDPTGSNPGIGGTRSNETSAAAAGGGDYISTEGLTNGINRRLVSTSLGAVNAINITPLVQQYLQCIRPNVSGNSYQFNLIIHGKNDMRTMVATTPANDPNGDGGTYAEYKFIPQGTVASTDWHLNDAYVSFKSVDNVGQSIVASNISFRKEMHYLFYNPSLALGSVFEGALCRSAANADNLVAFDADTSEHPQLHQFLDRLIVNSSGLGPTFGINQFAGETISATIIQGSGPSTVTCANKRFTLVGSGITSNGTVGVLREIKIRNNTGTPQSLFNFNTTQLNNASIIGGAGLQVIYNASLRYRLSSGNFCMRQWFSPSMGSENIIAIDRGASTDLPTFSQIGIVPGSYIRVSGASNPSNNGTYRVVQMKDGVDFVVLDTRSVDRFKYLYVDRPIVPEEAGSSITIENISTAGWPVLNIKYSVPT